MSVLDLLRHQLDNYTDIPKPVRASMAQACDEIELMEEMLRDIGTNIVKWSKNK